MYPPSGAALDYPPAYPHFDTSSDTTSYTTSNTTSNTTSDYLSSDTSIDSFPLGKAEILAMSPRTALSVVGHVTSNSPLMAIYSHYVEIMEANDSLNDKITKLKNRIGQIKEDRDYFHELYDTVRAETDSLKADLYNCTIWEKRRMLEQERRRGDVCACGSSNCSNLSSNVSNTARAVPEQENIHQAYAWY